MFPCLSVLFVLLHCHIGTVSYPYYTTHCFCVSLLQTDNMPMRMMMQYTEFVSAAKIKNAIGKMLIFLIFFAKKNDREYPLSLFWSKSKKNCIPPVGLNKIFS